MKGGKPTRESEEDIRAEAKKRARAGSVPAAGGVDFGPEVLGA